MNLLNKSPLSSFSDPSKIAFGLLLALPLPAVCVPPGAAILPSLAELRGWLGLCRVKGATPTEEPEWLEWWWTKVMKLLGQTVKPLPGERRSCGMWCSALQLSGHLRQGQICGAAQQVSRRSGALAAGSGAACAVLLCRSSLELLPAHLCLCQQSLPGWSRQRIPAAFQSGLLLREGDGAVILGRSPEQKPAVTSCVSLAGVTQLKVDGHPVAWAFLLREEEVEEESMSRKKTREFSDFALFLF